MASLATPKFPVSRTFFETRGPALSDAQRAAYRATARGRIDAVVRAEREFALKHRRQISSAQWKLARRKKQVRIYRRRGNSFDGSQPTMLGVGRMDGTLEDLIYGTYDKSTEEMKTTMSFVDIFTKDCAVLHNLELATPADPFHYVGIKWALSQLPGKLFVKPRDWCYIEAMGIERDAHGQRYGYTIVHSVDVPNCPPFDTKDVVRGKGSLSFVYREAEDAPGVIEIYAQGLFDPAGELIPYFSVIMTTEIFSGQALTVRCAEAKKLTLLALRNYRAGRGSREPVKKTCYMCVRRDGVFSSLKVCNICGVTTCEKCRVKRHIFMGTNHTVCEVACCQSCIFDAKSLQVRPAEEAFSLHTSMNRVPSELVSSRTMSNAMPSSTTSKAGTSRTMRFNSVSTAASGDEYGGNASDDDQFSKMDERDFEKIIEAMIDERLMGTNRGGHSSSRAGSHQLDLVPSMPYSVGALSAASTAMVPAVRYAAPVASSPVPPPPPSTRTTQEEQAAMFQKMVELQMAASQVFKITKANEEMMRKM